MANNKKKHSIEGLSRDKLQKIGWESLMSAFFLEQKHSIPSVLMLDLRIVQCALLTANNFLAVS